MSTETQGTDIVWQNIAKDTNPDEYNELYQTQLNRFLNGEVKEDIFTEFRLRHGVYGQKQEGVQMIRIKLPLGMVNFTQFAGLAHLADELADGVLHITTRQDIQYHNVNIKNTPELLERLTTVGITTNEACGNVTRNVTACTKAGVCKTEAFDTTADSLAFAEYLLGHPEAQNFGRKFKISFSGCFGSTCAMANIHDLGLIAKINNEGIAGYEVLIGGGLGAVPRQARLLYEFIEKEELFDVMRGVIRIFTRHGERKNRNKARFKFVVDKFGIDETRTMIEAERKLLPHDKTILQVLNKYNAYNEYPLKTVDDQTFDITSQGDPTYQSWLNSNVAPQKQAGYSTVTLYLPLGDISADATFKLIAILKKYINGTVRFHAEQNIVLRYVLNTDLHQLYQDLKPLNLNKRAGTLSDVMACPGSESCKLGISASRGIGGLLQKELNSKKLYQLGANKGIRIKISGCPNSCAQHHIAQIGFFGSAMSKQGKVAPVFQMVLGGSSDNNADSYGMAIGKISPYNILESVQILIDYYDKAKQSDEHFGQFIERIGKKDIKEKLVHLMKLPEFEDKAHFYSDIGRMVPFKVETGKGECAGELLPRTEFLLEECDHQNAQATLCLDDKRDDDAKALALSTIDKAVTAMLLTQGLEEFGIHNPIDDFKKYFVDNGIFHLKTADYYFRLKNNSDNQDSIRHLVEQATLFTEESHVVYSKIAQTNS